MTESKADTVTGRVIAQVLRTRDPFTTDEVAHALEKEPTTGLKHRIPVILATLEALGIVKSIVKGRWQRITSHAADALQWRGERVVMSFRLLGTGVNLAEEHAADRQRTQAMRLAAELTVEHLKPLRGKKLFFDSGRQCAYCAESIAKRLADEDSARRAYYRGATVFSGNLLAFLELVPFTMTGEIASFHMMGGNYVPGLGANVPSGADGPWQVLEEGLLPIVITSVAALSEHGMWTHFGQQAAWKKKLLEQAVSVYLVLDIGKLSLTDDTGHLFIHHEQDSRLWNLLWEGGKDDFHVVLGHHTGLQPEEPQLKAAQWLKSKLGSRLITHPDLEIPDPS
jgi:hypothetical protein